MQKSGFILNYITILASSLVVILTHTILMEQQYIQCFLLAVTEFIITVLKIARKFR